MTGGFIMEGAKTASIRKAAKMPDAIFNENQLRTLLKRGLLPGFYSGKKFNVRLDLLPALADELAEKKA